MKLVDSLIQKSIEAFTLSIEIYNKPTIKYRVEGFSFFICNVWELMLKAHMINKFGEKSIYYKNSERTLSLETCIKKLFTNNKDPLRINLEKIIELRNTSTHLIVREYETIYIQLFQACVFNFNKKIHDFHKVNLEECIRQHFLNLIITPDNLDPDAIRTKYSSEIAEKLINTFNEVTLLKNIQNNNINFAIKIDHQFYLTKKESEATAKVKVDSSSKNKVKIVKEVQNTNDTHPFTMSKCLEHINKRLSRNQINFNTLNQKTTFNQYHFDLFVKAYDVKINTNFTFQSEVLGDRYQYSNKLIEFIFDEIKKDPENIIQNLKEIVKKNKN